MVLIGLLVVFLVSICQAATDKSDMEAPFVTFSQGNSDNTKVGNMFADLGGPPLTHFQPLVTRGRSDIEIEEEQPLSGYFYPRPSKPFNLPEFKTLDANEPFVGVASFAQEDTEVERLPRSPRRRPPYFPSPPPFIPGFIPPNNIRPLPALYGRPMRNSPDIMPQ